MDSQAFGNIYFIWGVDDSPYGPVELPVLIDWINDERVAAFLITHQVGENRHLSDLSLFDKHEVPPFFGVSAKPRRFPG